MYYDDNEEKPLYISALLANGCVHKVDHMHESRLRHTGCWGIVVPVRGPQESTCQFSQPCHDTTARHTPHPAPRRSTPDERYTSP